MELWFYKLVPALELGSAARGGRPMFSEGCMRSGYSGMQSFSSGPFMILGQLLLTCH